MAHMMGDASGVNGVEEISQNINYIPPEFLTQILSHLPQKDLVLCRKVCPYWRDVIDLHCPMKDVIVLREDDKFLGRKLELRMSSCILLFFAKDTPNISLSHPQTIKTFEFCDTFLDDLNYENARGILSQIKPFVEILKMDGRYFKNTILSPPYLFPKVRELQIGLDYFPTSSRELNDNLEILFAHQLPLLEGFHLSLNYLDEELADEGHKLFLNFLAKHRHNVKRLVIEIYIGEQDQYQLQDDLPDRTVGFVLSEEMKGFLSKGQFQLESLELALPPKCVPAWTPIIQSQKKLSTLTVGYEHASLGPGGVPFYAIAPGILSNVSTLRTVSLHEISSVECDGMTWIPLDASVFCDAVNLTELDLRRNYFIQRNAVDTPRPSKKDGAEIFNLQEINSTSLKALRISDFVCNSGELQYLVDNSLILEKLYLTRVIAPRTSAKFAESGVHGGIVQSFVDKESKKDIEVCGAMNFEHEEQNKKFEAVRVLYPPAKQLIDRDTPNHFKHIF